MSIFGKSKTEDKEKGGKKPVELKADKKAKPQAKVSMKDLYGAGQKSVSPAAKAKPASAKASASAKATADKTADKTEDNSSFVKAAADKPQARKDQSASSAYRVLLRPLVTEKGSHLGAANKYLFEVDYNSNKIEIAKAIESAYGIRPTKVNIIKLAGKRVNRGRIAGRRKNWKKAIVTLPAGKTIQIYEGI